MLKNSAFNAQGSRLIIVVVLVGAVKIYVAAVEALLRKKERQGQNKMKLSLYFFAGVFFFVNLTRFWTKLRVLVLCFPDLKKNSIII